MSGTWDNPEDDTPEPAERCGAEHPTVTRDAAEYDSGGDQVGVTSEPLLCDLEPGSNASSDDAIVAAEGGEPVLDVHVHKATIGNGDVHRWEG